MDAADDDRSLAPLLVALREIDPPPPRPVTAPHTFGFRDLARLAIGEDEAMPARLANAGLERVGDRFSVGVDADGIIVHGPVRRRHIPWDRVRAVHMTSRYGLLRSGVIERMADDILRAFGPVPIPGLRRLVRMVTERLTLWVDERFDIGLLTGQDESSLGYTIERIECRRRDVTIGSALMTVAVFAAGTVETIEAEAVLRSVPVRRS